ncbi:hypothetical protein EKD04_009265 [Chloroflexales bacterium ZM16-3]|nr:hypothetical protein [Chloroflexales bacterium ZM16-3]
MSQPTYIQSTNTNQQLRRPLLLTLALIGMSAFVMIFASGCGGNAAAAEIAPIQAPQVAAVPILSPDQIATARELLVSQGCVGCHTIGMFPEAQGLIGPNLTHIATEVEQIILSPEYKASGGAAVNVGQYLYESILVPPLYVAPDCPMGECPNYVMPQNFGDRMTNEQINLIVDLFSTFK